MTHRMRHAVESRPLCVRRGSYGCAPCSNPYWTAGRSVRRSRAIESRSLLVPPLDDVSGQIQRLERCRRFLVAAEVQEADDGIARCEIEGCFYFWVIRCLT